MVVSLRCSCGQLGQSAAERVGVGTVETFQQQEDMDFEIRLVLKASNETGRSPSRYDGEDRCVVHDMEIRPLT